MVAAAVVVVTGRLLGVLKNLIQIRLFISVVLIVVLVLVFVVVLVVVGRSVDELAGEIENGARYHELLEEVAYFEVGLAQLLQLGVVVGDLERCWRRIGAIGEWRTPIAIRRGWAR